MVEDVIDGLSIIIYHILSACFDLGKLICQQMYNREHQTIHRLNVLC